MFIYVFNVHSRDLLIDAGYKLLKSDLKNNTFVFQNREEQNFALAKVSYILSDTLTF